MILIWTALTRFCIFWKTVLEYKTPYQEDRGSVCSLNSGGLLITCLLLMGIPLSTGWVRQLRWLRASVQVEERARWAQELIDVSSPLCSESRRKRALCVFRLRFRESGQWCHLSGVWRQTQKLTRMDGETCVGVGWRVGTGRVAGEWKHRPGPNWVRSYQPFKELSILSQGELNSLE